MSGAAAQKLEDRTVDVDAANHALEGAPAEEILRWAVDNFAPGKLAQISAFGPQSIIMIHMLKDIAPDLPVIFLDTLHHFPETLEHVERVRQMYDLNLHIYRPAPTIEAFEERYGPLLWERDLKLYSQVSKVEPFLEATKSLDGWITGRRREHSDTRKELRPIERSGGDKLTINPLVAWDRSATWRFILDNNLPYNPLHDQGYTSIGDAQFTTTVQLGEDERAGRWRGSGVTECGIHLV